MKRRAEHLVEKRDGRTEFVRATKLARSIHLALSSVGVDEDWRAIEVATAVLAGLRHRHGAVHASRTLLTTTEIADAVQQVLVATGHPAAAAAYGAESVERGRRRGALTTLGRAVAPTDVLPGTGIPWSPTRRLAAE